MNFNSEFISCYYKVIVSPHENMKHEKKTSFYLERYAVYNFFQWNAIHRRQRKWPGYQSAIT